MEKKSVFASGWTNNYTWLPRLTLSFLSAKGNGTHTELNFLNWDK